MPDKDFDKLFKDSFMDAEIEPSADLWGNIAEQLEPKKKRPFPILWMAAASVAVVASVMLFTQDGEKVYLQAAVETAAVKPEETVTPVVAPTEVDNTVSTAFLPKSTAPKNLAKQAVVKVVPAEIANEQKNIITSVQPSTQVAHLPIKKVDAKPLDVIPQETIVENNNAKMIAQADPKRTSVDEVDVIDEANDNKKGIRNVGDLINYVVDKVDKRDKKLIKFNTDDDDNSSIIGLNIGFVKLNKKNK